MSELNSINVIEHKRAAVKTNTAAVDANQHSVESEQCVLGSLLLDNSTYQSISPIINEQDFYGHDHKTIYRAIQSQADKGEPFDIFTITETIREHGGLKESDTGPYLAVLAHDTPSTATVAVHAKTVRKYSLERKAKAALANHDFVDLGNICNEINNLSNGITVNSSLKMIDEILDRPMTHDWLVKGWIERQQTCVLWGASQSYKTLLAIEIACAIAKGLEWRGNKVKQGAVLYVVGEGGGNGITRRFKAWSIANKVDLKGAPIIVREASTILPQHTDQLIKETEELLKERGLTLELVILDTLSRTMQGDENSQKDFNEYQHALDVIRDKFQCAVMFLHHIGHGDKTRARGASAIRCNVDVELSMEPVGDKVSKLHAWKVKDSSASDDMCFQLTVVDLGCFDEDGDPITSVVLLHLEDYEPTTSAARMSDNERLALGIIERMQRDTSVTDSVTDQNVTVVTDVAVTDWRSAFYAEVRKKSPEINQNTLRQNWNRAINGLANKEKVTLQGIDNTRASVTALQKRDNVTVVTGASVTGVTHTYKCVTLSRSDVTPGGNKSKENELPDFGTSDDGYFVSIQEGVK